LEETVVMKVKDELHIWSGLSGAEEAKAWVESHLAASRKEIAGLLAISGTRTVENTPMTAPAGICAWRAHRAA
jgi:hypothetical protein